MVTCSEIYASVIALLTSVTWLNGTAGGRVPYRRTASVHTGVTCPTARVAVGVRLAGAPGVAVAGVVVKLSRGVEIAPVAVAVLSASRVGVEVAGTTSVGGRVAEAGRVAVSKALTSVGVG